MAKLWVRLGLAGISLASLVFAGMAMVLSTRTPAGAAFVYTVDVLPTGFNPEICTVNRNGDSVRWHNKTSQVVKIALVDEGGINNPLQEVTEDIAPNATSQGSVAPNAQVNRKYIDVYLPSREGRIVAPQDPNAAAQCSPLPPTPTPTPTRSPTATPTVTPRPTPIQRPARCIGATGCALAPDITREEEAAD